MRALEPVEAAYIAGFVDGEGCINVLRAQKRYLVELYVAQIDRKPIDFLHERMGGSVCVMPENRAKNKRPLWVYHLNSGPGFDFYIRQLLPYLVLKRRKAELALEMRARIGTRGKRLTDDERRARDEILQRAKAEQAICAQRA